MASPLFPSGTAFLTGCPTPRVRVSWDIGHPPQAPFNLTFTTPSVVTSTSSTSPPSACRAGLINAKALSTFSFIDLPSFHWVSKLTAMDQHGQASRAHPEFLPSFSTRKQNTLIFCLLTKKTVDLFFLFLLLFSSHSSLL